jgi:hypothetical protein
LSDIINSAGWEIWSSSEPNTEDVTFEEVRYHINFLCPLQLYSLGKI